MTLNKIKADARERILKQTELIAEDLPVRLLNEALLSISEDTLQKAHQLGLEEGKRRAEKEILNKLKSTSLHAEAIRATLGEGHHYSTMPVVAGLVSRIEGAIKDTTYDTQ